jgi:hypothetical protein
VSETFKLDRDLLVGLDAYLKEQSDGAAKLTREEALTVIVRDWLQGQGYLAIPGEKKHTTARKAAGVPSGYLDP